MRELSTYLSERLGFDLFTDAEQLERAIGIVEARNIIVHNRGRVSKIYCSRVPKVAVAIGEPLTLDNHQIFEDLEFLMLVVKETDLRAVHKFDLPKIPKPTK